jgi:hypothetical protein
LGSTKPQSFGVGCCDQWWFVFELQVLHIGIERIATTRRRIREKGIVRGEVSHCELTCASKKREKASFASSCNNSSNIISHDLLSGLLIFFTPLHSSANNHRRDESFRSTQEMSNQTIRHYVGRLEAVLDELIEIKSGAAFAAQTRNPNISQAEKMAICEDQKVKSKIKRTPK